MATISAPALNGGSSADERPWISPGPFFVALNALALEALPTRPGQNPLCHPPQFLKHLSLLSDPIAAIVLYRSIGPQSLQVPVLLLFSQDDVETLCRLATSREASEKHPSPRRYCRWSMVHATTIQQFRDGSFFEATPIKD